MAVIWWQHCGSEDCCGFVVVSDVRKECCVEHVCGAECVGSSTARAVVEMPVAVRVNARMFVL